MFNPFFVWLLSNWRKTIPLLVTVLTYLSMHIYGEFKYKQGIDVGRSEMIARYEAEKRAFEKRLVQANTLLTQEREKRLEQENIQRQELENVFKNPIYSADCIDDAGVQSINRAAGN